MYIYLCVLFLKGKSLEIPQEYFPVRLNKVPDGHKRNNR
jgi:hypothetical protein